MPRVSGAAMEICGDEDDLAVAALEAAMTEREDGEIDDDQVVPMEPVRMDASATPEITFPIKWVTASSHELIAKAQETAPNMNCQLCDATCLNRKRLRLHAGLHYVHCFCNCGYNSRWRETVRSHQKDLRNLCDVRGLVYDVDATSFDSSQRTLRTTLDSYPGEVPTHIFNSTATSNRPSSSSATSSTVSTAPSRAVSRLDTRHHTSSATTAPPTTNSKNRKHHSGSKSAKDRKSTSDT